MKFTFFTLIVLVVLCTFFLLGSAGDMSKYYKRTGAKYLKEKAQEDGVITLKSGMLVEILKETTKESAKSPREGGKSADDC